MIYKVPLIGQPTNMSCWATSIAMVRSWKDNACYDPRLIALDVGGLDYTAAFQNDGPGLNPNDTYILRRNGLTTLAPQCYTVGAIQSLLNTYGPLWVASAVPDPHIRVVTGLTNRTVYVNDPWPVGVGSQYPMDFDTFFGSMEDLGTQELDQPAPVYVAHL